MITSSYKSKIKGFTLVEMIVVFGILSIFAGMSLAYFNSFTSRKQTEVESNKLVDVLELAKKKAFSGDIPSQCTSKFLGYRVKVLFNGYELYFNCQNTSYQLMQSYTFVSGITSSVGAGGATIDFPPLTLNQSVTVTPNGAIRLTNSDASSCYQITVNSAGIISNGPVDCPQPI